MSKKAVVFVFAFLFKSLITYTETLPLELFWKGKTALALKSAQTILEKKTIIQKLNWPVAMIF